MRTKIERMEGGLARRTSIHFGALEMPKIIPGEVEDGYVLVSITAYRDSELAPKRTWKEWVLGMPSSQAPWKMVEIFIPLQGKYNVE